MSDLLRLASVRVGKCPGWQMSGWQVSSWQVSGWQVSGWQVSGWQISAHRENTEDQTQYDGLSGSRQYFLHPQ